jgi:hypothetical protein
LARGRGDRERFGLLTESDPVLLSCVTVEKKSGSLRLQRNPTEGALREAKGALEDVELKRADVGR